MSEQDDKQINNMKVNMAKIDEKLNGIKTAAETANIVNQREHAEIKKMINELDRSYAGKWVEKVAVGLMISFIGGISIAILTYIINT